MSSEGAGEGFASNYGYGGMPGTTTGMAQGGYAATGNPQIGAQSKYQQSALNALAAKYGNGGWGVMDVNSGNPTTGGVLTPAQVKARKAAQQAAIQQGLIEPIDAPLYPFMGSPPPTGIGLLNPGQWPNLQGRDWANWNGQGTMGHQYPGRDEYGWPGGMGSPGGIKDESQVGLDQVGGWGTGMGGGGDIPGSRNRSMQPGPEPSAGLMSMMADPNASSDIMTMQGQPGNVDPQRQAFHDAMLAWRGQRPGRPEDMQAPGAQDQWSSLIDAWRQGKPVQPDMVRPPGGGNNGGGINPPSPQIGSRPGFGQGPMQPRQRPRPFRVGSDQLGLRHFRGRAA